MSNKENKNEKVKCCPWCGNNALNYEVHNINPEIFNIHFNCDVCGMDWFGPDEKEKRYPSGKRPSESTIKFYINKMVTQEYINNSTDATAINQTTAD